VSIETPIDPSVVVRTRRWPPHLKCWWYKRVTNVYNDVPKDLCVGTISS